MKAEVVLIVDELCKVNRWKVVKCPFCGCVHYHGAGKITDDPMQYLGSRASHCVNHRIVQRAEYDGSNGQYMLEWYGETQIIKKELL